MENTTTQGIATTDGEWKAFREEALNCPSYDLETLIARMVAAWDSARIGYKALTDARLDRDKNASLAKSLREAEQAIEAVLTAAIRDGRSVESLKSLVFAMMDCQVMIVYPVARRMAENDDTKRSADDIAFHIASKAKFVGGRAVIDQALASELPCPFTERNAT